VGPVWNPATGEQQAQVALAEPADVDAAVAAASKAWQEWRDVSVIRRARIMFALRDLIERHLDEISVLVADEHGKVVSDAKGEVIRGLEVVEYACGIPTLLKGEFSEQVSTDVDAYSFRSRSGSAPGSPRSTSRPLVPMWMHPIAIAAGTPSSSSRASATRPRRTSSPGCYAEAGLPEGVFNVVHGDKVAVDAIPGPPRHRGGLVRRLDADRQVRAPAGPPKPASACRPSAARRTTPWCSDADMEFAANHITAAATARPGSGAWPSPP